jgi:outer membrane receptor protein involved in Fe transport
VQYPSASVAWRLSEEPFLGALKEHFLDNLKIRLSWGSTGKMTIDPYSTLGRLSTTYYAWDEKGIMGTIPSVIPNKQLVWEQTKEYNLGIDFNLFKGRLNGTLDLYNKDTDGLILGRNLPPTSGYSSFQQNIGKTRNRGVELMMKGDVIRNKDWIWNVGLTFYKNKNEIIDLYGDKKDDVGSTWFIGQPIRVWYMYKFTGVWQENEVEEAAKYGAKPGYPKFLDVKNPEGGAVRINPDEDRIVISKEPNWIASWNTTVSYKEWDLYINMNTRQGQRAGSNVHMAGGGDPGRYNVISEDYWTPENKSNTAPAPWASGRYANFNNSDWWVKDVSFVRLSNVSLGYTLPKKASRSFLSEHAKVYINVTNPYVWSKYRGQDPEITDQGLYPAVTSYQFGINLSF